MVEFDYRCSDTDVSYVKNGPTLPLGVIIKNTHTRASFLVYLGPDNDSAAAECTASVISAAAQ